MNGSHGTIYRPVDSAMTANNKFTSVQEANVRDGTNTSFLDKLYRKQVTIVVAYS